MSPRPQAAAPLTNSAILSDPGLPFQKAKGRRPRRIPDRSIPTPRNSARPPKCSWSCTTNLSVFGDAPFDATAKLCDRRVLLRGLAYPADTIFLGTGVNALADGDDAAGDLASLVTAPCCWGNGTGTRCMCWWRRKPLIISSASSEWRNIPTRRRC